MMRVLTGKPDPGNVNGVDPDGFCRYVKVSGNPASRASFAGNIPLAIVQTRKTKAKAHLGRLGKSF